MLKSVIILGAGGHAKVIADIILKCGDRFLGFLDDTQMKGSQVLGFPVLGKISELNAFTDTCNFIIGIGANEIRKKIDQAYNVNWYTAIHPSASISIGVEIGEGTTIMANAVINAAAHIGRHCIINTGAIVEHDNVIDDYTHLSPNVSLGGKVKIGEGAHIGIGATVINNIEICGESVVGAGSVVIRNITEKGIYVGSPTHKLGG